MNGKRVISVLVCIAMVATLLGGCGKEEKSADSALKEALAKKGLVSEEDAGEESPAAKSAPVPGYYDLWTIGSGSGDYWTELPHEEMAMTGYVLFNEDHSGKMGQGVSGEEMSDMEITWNDDGSIEMFGNKLYTWEVSGDVLTITMGEASKFYYVRQGVDGAVAFNNFKSGKGSGGTVASAGGEGDNEYASADDNEETIPIPSDCMYRVCAVEDMGKMLTGDDLKKWGYDEYWLQSQEGSKIDFDLGTGDVHDGDYYMDDIYGAITKYTTITDPLYPYKIAADGDIIFLKVRGDNLILARDDVDADAAMKKAGDFPTLKIKDGDVRDDLTGYAPTPRDIKYPMKGGNLYFDPVNGHVKYIEPTVTEIDYPRGFDGIGLWEIKKGIYDAKSLRIFHCAPDMFPVTLDKTTGKYEQDIYCTHAGFGCAALGHALFCHGDNRPAASDSLGSIEYFEYGPAFLNANLGDLDKLLSSLSKNIRDYKMMSGKDQEIKKLAQYVLDNDRDEVRMLERVGKFARADYIYDYDSDRYDTKHADEKMVAKKEELRKSLNAKGHGLYNEGRAYLMRDMLIAAGIPCVTAILGKTDVYGDVYESYQDYFDKNYVAPTKSRHADDYANDEIPEDTQEQIDAVMNAAPECKVYNLAYAGGSWHMIDGDGIVDLGKGIGPNGLFLRFQILEVDGENFDHVDRQAYFKEVYDMQLDYTKKAIAKGELPDWSAFDHVLDDSGFYKLYDGIDENGKVTLPADTDGKNDAWIKLNMDGTGELEWYGFHSNVSWCSNAGNLTCCSSDEKACASFHGFVAARETRDTTGCRWDGKSREHGIDARVLYIKDGEYVEQFFHVLEPYGESMMLFDTDNLEEDGYRYRFLKDTGTKPGSYGKSPWE